MGRSTKCRPRPEGGPHHSWAGDSTPCPEAASFSDSALSFVWMVITTLVSMPFDLLCTQVTLFTVSRLVHCVQLSIVAAHVLWNRSLRRAQGV